MASFNNVAAISCAWVAVIATDCIVMYDSSGLVAVVFSASVVVIDWLVGEDASCARIASIDSAKIMVVASDWSVLASFNNVTRFFCAFVSISASNRGVNAETRVDIARVNCASILVITADISIDALS